MTNAPVDISAAAIPADLSDINHAYAPYIERVRALLRRYSLIVNVVDTTPQGEDLAQQVAFRGLSGVPLPERLKVALDSVNERLSESYESLARRSDAEGVARFERIRLEFSLTDLDCDVLWILLCAETLVDILWLLRTLWADKEGIYPGRTFLAHVLDPESKRAREVVTSLSRSSTLFVHRLCVEIGANALEESSVAIAPSRLLLRFLLELEGELPSIPGLIALHQLKRAEADEHALPSTLDFLDSGLQRRLRTGFSKSRCFLLFGSDNTAPLRLACDVMASQDLPLIEVDAATLLEEGVEALATLLGEAKLRRAGIFFDRVEALGREDAEPLLTRRFFEMLSKTRVPQFHRATFGIPPHLRLRFARDLQAVELRLLPPGPEEREIIWSSRLAKYFDEKRVQPIAFAARVYPFGISEIDDAVSIAVLQAQRRDLKERLLLEDVEYACRSLSSQRIGQYAQRVQVMNTWDEVILKEETLAVISEIVRFGKHRVKVMEEQGYGAKMGYGKGLNALFYGPPGTGKTLVSGLLARELGLELYQIELSQIVSKYIGETEQRLAEIFDESEATGMALLFDEADSLFAKRTEVKSSVDRYANLEVNFLLQRLERHDGVVIMTTNFPSSLDEAFMRRIRFKAEFPAPESAERYLLWKTMIPDTAPVDAGLELQDLADLYEMTGGEIRNAVLRAAFYAADMGVPLALKHLERSARVEYRDGGRLMPPAICWSEDL